MRHAIFTTTPEESYKVAVLVKATAFNVREIGISYTEPLEQLGVSLDSMIAFSLDYNKDRKAPNAFIKEYLAELMPVLDELKVQYLYVADANYFKVLAGQTKADIHFGYVLPCKLKGYEHMHVVLGLNHQSLIYNPELQSKLDLSLTTLSSHTVGNYSAIGTDIIHSASYPSSLEDIKAALDGLHQFSELSCDIEAFSLRFNEAGIGSISFAWDQHNGLAFACASDSAVGVTCRVPRGLLSRPQVMV